MRDEVRGCLAGRPSQKVWSIVVVCSFLVLFQQALAGQTVSIVSATSPVAPGQTLFVGLGATAGPAGAATGCVLTLVPYGQGNVASIVSLHVLPPLQGRIAIPSKFPLGVYAVELNCDTLPPAPGAPNPFASLGPGYAPPPVYLSASRNVVVWAPPTVTEYGPVPTTIRQQFTVHGAAFGPTQGPGYVKLAGSGVPDVYVTAPTAWSDTQVVFNVPEYAASGSYTLVVQTNSNGPSAPSAPFTISPAISGWVDLHTHVMSNLGFGGKLIYGAVDDSGSLFALGTPTNVAGVVAPGSPCPKNRVASESDALSQERSVRGIGGLTTGDNPCGDAIRAVFMPILEGQLTPAAVWPVPTGGTGFPNFPTWPAWDDLVNQKMYYTWIKRAYQGGQRVLVALAVNSRLLADVTSGPGDGPDDDKASGDLQIAEIKAFVARHSDFMQIASSSSDLWSIVSQNKLAIILGVELDNIGDLVGNQPAAALSAEVDRLFNEGVRYIFPIHLVDNPIGGSAVYVPLFDVADAYEEGASGYSLGCASDTDSISFVYQPPSAIIQAIAVGKRASLVTIPAPGPSCGMANGTHIGNVNLLGLTPAGESAIQEMMNKHMLIDIDHMSERAANMAIALAQNRQPRPYPLFSGHNGVRGAPLSRQPKPDSGFVTSERSLTARQYKALGDLHGMAGVGSAKLAADQWLELYSLVIKSMGPGAVAGFGTDMNGMEFAMPPRPFSNVAAKYGTKAFPLAMSSEGNKHWNYDSVGVAHYGMLPDFLQDVASLSGGNGVVSNMGSGAQYLWETWRIVEGNAPVPPKPPQPKWAGPPSVAVGVCPGTEILNTSPFGATAPACVCGWRGGVALQPGPTGACPGSNSAAAATSNPVSNGNTVSCPSECKYGCNQQTRVCNGPPKQTHPSSP